MNNILRQYTDIRLRRELFDPKVSPILNDIIWNFPSSPNESLKILLESEWKTCVAIQVIINGSWRNVTTIGIMDNGIWNNVIL